MLTPEDSRELSRDQRSELTARLVADLFAAVERGDELDQEALRHQIVLANAAVARRLSRRFQHRGLADDDLEQTAYVALVAAVRRFDPAHGHDLLSYVVPCITGELKRHFRDHGWTIRVPRRLQEVQGLIARDDAEVLDEPTYSTVTVAHLAVRLGLTTTEVVAALGARGCFRPASLDAPAGEEGFSVGDLLASVEDGSGDRAHDEAEARAMVAAAIRLLGDDDRRVLRLRYDEDRSQQAVARELGISQAQVSRTLLRIHDTLRPVLSQEDSATRAG